MERLLRQLASLVRLKPGRPALTLGLRAALATGAPLMLGLLVLRVPGASWMGLAGFLTTLGDKGGPYRTRALSTGGVAVVGALGVALGAVVAGHPVVAVGLAFLWVTCASYIRCFGEEPASLGTLVSVAFVASLAQPAHGLGDAVMRAGLFLAGSAWAVFLALLLWPVHPYAPARAAVADCLSVVAALADEVAGQLGGVARGAAPGLSARSHVRVRQAIETARATLAATRRARPGESARGVHLLRLVELADLAFATLVALEHDADVAVRASEAAEELAQTQASVQGFAASFRRIAGEVEQRRKVTPGEPVQPTAAVGPPPMEAERGDHLARLRASLGEYARAGLSTVALIEGKRPPSDELAPTLLPSTPRRSFLAPLREHLTPDSLVLRHSLRAGIVTAVAMALVQGLGLRNGHWVVLTAIVVLQPYSGATVERGLQRIGGTVLGAMLAAALAASFHSPLSVLLLVMGLTGLSVSILPLNYGAFSVFLTPAFVLLAEVQSGNWKLAGLRALCTLLGGVLALCGTWLLWPSPERTRFPEEAAGVLRADGDYLRAVLESPGGEGGRAAHEARRKLGLVLLDTEASFQRLLTESGGPPERQEAMMSLLVSARGLGSTATALAASLPSDGAASWPAGIQALGHRVVGALEELADAVADSRAPAPLPPLELPPGEGTPFMRAQLERVVRRLTTLHGAVARLKV